MEEGLSTPQLKEISLDLFLQHSKDLLDLSCLLSSSSQHACMMVEDDGHHGDEQHKKKAIHCPAPTGTVESLYLIHAFDIAIRRGSRKLE